MTSDQKYFQKLHRIKSQLLKNHSLPIRRADNTDYLAIGKLKSVFFLVLLKMKSVLYLEDYRYNLTRAVRLLALFS